MGEELVGVWLGLDLASKSESLPNLLWGVPELLLVSILISDPLELSSMAKFF